MLLIELAKRPDESEIQYSWRLFSHIQSGEMSWQELADLMNQYCREDVSEWRTESAYRQPLRAAERYYNEIFSQTNSDEAIEKIKEEHRELEKERVKIRDERNEYRRLLREQARRESLTELIERTVNEYKPVYDIENTAVESSDNDLIVHLTDIHHGIKIDNYFNKYDDDVLLNRLSRFIAKIKEVKERHNPENCYIILGGDALSGIIHNSLRLENNKNVIEQTISISEIIADFIAKLSPMFKNVTVGFVNGNHGRINPDKEFGDKGENFENFIPAYLKVRLREYNNLIFVDNEIDESIGHITVRGNEVYYTHGDKDTVQNIVQRLKLMVSEKVDLVYMGHRHTNGMTTVYTAKVIESGCLSGSDNYCMDKRLFSYPQQTISVINKDGLDCLYNVTFKN